MANEPELPISTHSCSTPECSICIDTEDDDFDELPCGHKFHLCCLTNYITYNTRRQEIDCPLCREVFMTNRDDPLSINIENRREPINNIQTQYHYHGECSGFIYCLFLVAMFVIIMISITRRE
jgi:hypothetical protein